MVKLVVKLLGVINSCWNIVGRWNMSCNVCRLPPPILLWETKSWLCRVTHCFTTVASATIGHVPVLRIWSLTFNSLPKGSYKFQPVSRSLWCYIAKSPDAPAKHVIMVNQKRGFWRSMDSPPMPFVSCKHWTAVAHVRSRPKSRCKGVKGGMIWELNGGVAAS